MSWCFGLWVLYIWGGWVIGLIMDLGKWFLMDGRMELDFRLGTWSGLNAWFKGLDLDQIKHKTK